MESPPRAREPHQAPVLLEFNMADGRGRSIDRGRNPSRGSQRCGVASKPWRKSAAECAEQRRAARELLSADGRGGGGVNTSALELALHIQELGGLPDVPAAVHRELEAASAALRQAATNARSVAEVNEAQVAAEAATQAAGLGAQLAELRRRPEGATLRQQLLHKVVQGLWLGGWAALNNGCEALKAKGVTHVVSVISADEHRLPPFILGHYHAFVDDKDSAAETLADHFEPISKFIAAAIGSGGTVFVHCGAGISRSPTVVAAYMVWHLQIPAATALNLIRRARPNIRPNLGFVSQLKAWEVRWLPQDSVTWGRQC